MLSATEKEEASQACPTQSLALLNDSKTGKIPGRVGGYVYTTTLTVRAGSWEEGMRVILGGGSDKLGLEE